MFITPVNPQETRSTSTAPRLPLRSAAQGTAWRIHVWKSLRLHSVTAVLVTVVVLGLGLAALMRHGVSYVAESTIYVSPTFPKTLIEDREQERPYDSYVQEQVHSITRYDVLEDALHSLPRGAWQRPGETERAAIDRLKKSLDIARVGLTYQVSITLHRSTPDHLADIVNAVTQSYISKAKNEEYYGRDDRLNTLRATRDDLRKELDARTTELSTITQELGMAKVDSDGSNPFDDELAKMRTDLTTAHEQRVQAEAQLSALRNSDPSTPNAALNAAADELVANDPGLMALKTDLAKKRSTLVEQLSTLTPNHPLRKQTEEQLNQIDQALQSMQLQLQKKAAAQLELKDRAELNRASAVETKLLSDLRRETGTAASAAPKLQRAEDLKAEIAHLTTRYSEVADRISNLELESSSPGSIHLFAPALPPTGPEPSKIRFLLPLLLPFSILVGIAAAVAMDIFDPYIHTATDMEALLGFAPIGVLMDDQDVTQRVFDECSLRLAAGIDHAVRTSGARTFVFTGIAGGAGVTSIVHSMGSTLARLGHKTLTIDASGNTDPVAYVTLGVNDSVTRSVQDADFGVPADGLQTVASGQLDATTVFPKPLSGAMTPLCNFAGKAFKTLSKEYEIILIDGAPLLASAETEYLARSADVTILVSEAGKTTKRRLTRATRLLERLDVSGVAAVINRVRLARAESDLQNDLRDAESRISAMNMKWRPNRHKKNSGTPAYSTTPHASIEQEIESFANGD
ncbi:MAG TPA: hypothetical protein VHB45_08185 [Alloacidobacterium sp.]|nr:hypothetical protein [Alloacidobacterium sp.]